MRTYELTEEQEIQILRNKLEQEKKYQKWKKKMMKKDSSIPTIGDRLTFCFTPTGLGTIVKVIDLATNEEIDLTDWENF